MCFIVLSSDKNETNEVDVGKCGIHYCPEKSSGNTTDDDEDNGDDNFSITHDQLYILASVYLICSILAWTIVSLFLDPLSRYEKIVKFFLTQ